MHLGIFESRLEGTTGIDCWLQLSNVDLRLSHARGQYLTQRCKITMRARDSIIENNLIRFTIDEISFICIVSHRQSLSNSGYHCDTSCTNFNNQSIKVVLVR